MFTLGSEITIGGKKFGGVHDVRIKRSIYDLAATATVKVPVTAVLKQRDGRQEAKPEVEVAKEIKVGDAVEIRLGYDGNLTTEFKGFVRHLNLKTPLEIVCEDAFFQCRRRGVTLSGKTTLEEVLGKCGLEVGYAAKLAMEGFQVPNKPVSWVLAKLKKDYGLAVFFDLEGRVYASEPFKTAGGTVKYRLRYNVIKDDDLQYRRAEDVKLKINAVCICRDGTRVEAKAGAENGVENGVEKTLYFYDVQNEAELAALAEAELKRHSYDGYAGKLQTFLLPVAAPCMLAEVEDEVYPDRNGRYYIESVETSFGTSGGRRMVEIGIKA